MRNSIRILIATLLFFVNSPSAVAGKKIEDEHQEVNIPGERPFDGVNIFGDLRRMEELSDTHQNKLWWERMARGEVGRDRFLHSLRPEGWRLEIARRYTNLSRISSSGRLLGEEAV